MNQLQEYLVHEFVEDYRDGYLSRRDLIRKVLYITGGVASTAMLLSSFGCGPTAAGGPTAAAPTGAAASAPTPAAGGSPSPTPASAGPTARASAAAPTPAAGSTAVARSPLSVAENDPAVDGRDLSFPGNGATIFAYEARPRGASAPLPLVLVCHQNTGLNGHIKDIARRFAKEGYLACAVDLLSHEGGTAKLDPSKIPGMLSSIDPTRHVGNFQAAAAYYAGQSFADHSRLAINGFCFGGGIVWRALEAMPELKAAAPFYGPPPPLDGVKNIKAAVLGVYSSDPKDFANKDRDKLEAALKAAGVTYEFKVYPNTQHAFNDDTSPRYNQEQALAAWKDMTDWFARYLKA